MDPKKKNQIKIVIVGAGGFGKEVLLTLNDCNKHRKKFDVLGFIDENKSLYGKKINKKPVLGGLDWFANKKPKDVSCIIAVGDSKIRQKVVKKLEKFKIKFQTIIHPSVICSKFVNIGEGTVIQAGSIINPDTKIGKHVQINMDCSVAHDCTLKDFVTLAPGVHVNGENVIGEGTFLGTGAVTRDKIKIGKWSIIGAGTVIIKDAKQFSLYIGVPGKKRKNCN